MNEIKDLLEARIHLYNEFPPEKVQEDIAKRYQKDWNNAIEFFQRQINKEREDTHYPQLSFIVVRQKLEHIKDINDLRWFYKECIKSKNKEGQSFSKTFFGALKIK